MKMGEKDHFDHSDRRTLCHARHLPACYRSAGYHRPGARLLWARVLPGSVKRNRSQLFGLAVLSPSLLLSCCIWCAWGISAGLVGGDPSSRGMVRRRPSLADV